MSVGRWHGKVPICHAETLIESGDLFEEYFESRVDGTVSFGCGTDDHAAVSEGVIGEEQREELLDQHELVRMNDGVVRGTILGGAHPVVKAVDGDERWWTRLGARLGEFPKEMLPDLLGDGRVFAA